MRSVLTASLLMLACSGGGRTVPADAPPQCSDADRAYGFLDAGPTPLFWCEWDCYATYTDPYGAVRDHVELERWFQMRADGGWSHYPIPGIDRPIAIAKPGCTPRRRWQDVFRGWAL